MTDTTSTEIARVAAPTYSRWDMPTRQQYAMMLAGAKEILPAGIKANTPQETAARVFLALETGDMLGLHPMAAINGIDVIEGNPTISPQLALGLIRKAGHKVRIEETGTVEGGDLRVTATGIRHDDPDSPIVKSYTIHDAARAGLCKYERDERTGIWKVTARSRNGNPLNWEKFPADMCQWRAVGRLMRAGASDVMLGVSYFPEELEATVDASGTRAEVVDDGTFEEIRERIRAIDDKADMATLWHELNQADKFTDRVKAEFDAHLSTLTKDSRPPKDGAPGNTGIAAIDAPAESGQSAEEPPAPATDAPESAHEPAEEIPAPQTADSPEPDIEAEREREAAEYERRSAEEFEAAQAAQQTPPMFDPSALGGGR